MSAKPNRSRSEGRRSRSRALLRNQAWRAASWRNSAWRSRIRASTSTTESSIVCILLDTEDMVCFAQWQYPISDIGIKLEVMSCSATLGLHSGSVEEKSSNESRQESTIYWQAGSELG